MPDKGLVYYTDNHCDENIMKAVIDRLKITCKGFHIVSVSHKPVDFGDNFVMDLPRGWPSIFKQILLGLIANDAHIIYLIEHDVFYHPSHFDFVPISPKAVYYNLNRWVINLATGEAIYGKAWMLSQLVAYKDTLIDIFTKRVQQIETEGFRKSMASAPVAHVSRNGDHKYKLGAFNSKYPNIDIRHGDNFTPDIPKRDDFIISNVIPGWGKAERIAEELNG